MEEKFEYARPKVGVAVYVLNHEGKILMGKRLGSLCAETYACPGGHLEGGESFEECARREVMEETGCTLGELKMIGVTNDVMPKDGKHYVTIHLVAKLAQGEPQILEPDRIQCWQWVDWESPLTPEFPSIQNLRAMGLSPLA